MTAFVPTLRRERSKCRPLICTLPVFPRQTHACAAQVREQIDAIAFDLANPNASNTPLQQYIAGATGIKAPPPARRDAGLG